MKIQKNKDDHYVLNMFDNSILHDSFLQSALRCGVSGDEKFEKKPEKVRYVKNRNPWNGVTIFTDKMFQAAPHIKSDIKVAWVMEPYDLLPNIYDDVIALEEHFDLIFTFEKFLLERDPN